MTQHTGTISRPTNRTASQPGLTTRTFIGSRWSLRLTLLALAILSAYLGIRPLAVPPPLPATVGDADFSIQRALNDLTTITAAPRAPGMPGLAAAREYLAGELAALGLEVQIGDELMVRQSAENGLAVVAQSHNIVARLSGYASTGAVVIAGHLDSVHTTTGASDCGGCAVAVVETARALVAAPPLRNDIIFLIEDGEETTRAGSLSFVERHPWAKDVRVAINQESMGSAGASMLYVTGPDSGWLIAEALRVMPHNVAYSFVNDLVWTTGTGGSDLDQLLMVAPVGLGLIYLGNEPAYHTMQDSVASLDPRSLQHQGETGLALLRHYGDLALDGTLTAPDSIYFTLVNGVTVRYSEWVAILLASLAAAGYIALLVYGLRSGRVAGTGVALGPLTLLLSVVLATAASGGLWHLLRLLDPRLQVFLIGITYDRPWYTLAFVLLSAGVTIAAFSLYRRRAWLDLAVGALAGWVLLILLTTWKLPGSSPAFTLPALLMLLPSALSLADASRGARLTALALASGVSMLLVAPMINFLGIFSGRAELIMGLPVIGLLPAPFAALLAALLLPLWHELQQPRRWVVASVFIGVGVAILLGVGLMARFTPDRPKPNMVAYVQEDGVARWIAVAAPHTSRASLQDAWTIQFLGDAPEATTFNPWGAYFVDVANPALAAPAPALTRPAPRLSVLSETPLADGNRRVHARLDLVEPAPMLILRLYAADGSAARIAELNVLGAPLAEIARPDAPATSVWLELYGIESSSIELELTLAGEGALSLWLEERLFSLPDFDGTPARPADMMPSPTFISDSSLLRTSFTLP